MPTGNEMEQALERAQMRPPLRAAVLAVTGAGSSVGGVGWKYVLRYVTCRTGRRERPPRT